MSEPGVNSTVRLLGGGAPGEKPAPLHSRPAAAPPVSVAPPPSPIAAPAQGEPIFLGDAPDGADVLNAREIIEPLAVLCVTREVQTPILAGVVGPSGSGKTYALTLVAREIERLAAAPAASNALTRLALARVDAASGAEAPVAIASAAYAALSAAPGGVDYSALLDETAHAGGDPLRAAAAASDRHDDIVRRLEAERSQRDEVEARRARLADTLLYDTPGSRVDVFARSNRGTIEGRLRRFGLAGPDAGAVYRDFVRDLAGLGAGARLGIVLRAIWGYPSQARLLFWASVAFVLAFGANMLRSGSNVAAIDRMNELLQPVTAWISTHGEWFDRAAEILFILGVLALALNLWRALGFSTLLFRGVRLLNQEVRERRRDLDARAEQLSQRVTALTADAEAAARHAEAANRRAGGKAAARAPGPEFLEAAHGPQVQARAFLAALGARLGPLSSAGAAPERLIFLIDNLDALTPAAAIGWIDAAQGVVGPGSIALLAFDPTRLLEALGGPRNARRRFDKWLQAVVNLPSRYGADGERLLQRLLSFGGRPASTPPADAKIAAALVEPLTGAEAALLAALAPLVAQSPRNAKRFLNAYRLARSSSAPRPIVALMQAAAFADDETQAAMRERLANGSGELVDMSGPPALVNAIKSARAANNGVLPIEDVRAAAEIARRYALAL